MNKKILAAAIAAFLMTPVAFAAYNADSAANTTTTDDADDKQTVTVMIPEVALLDIDDAIVDLNEAALIAPTNAGDGFTGTATSTSSYAVSSNVQNVASPTMRSITVQVDSAVGKVPAGAQLSVALNVPTANATAGTAILTSTTTTAEASATAIGNARGSGLQIAYTLATDPAGTGMIAYTGTDGTTSDNIGLIYTLTDD